jgi:transcription antitermination factor NusG
MNDSKKWFAVYTRPRSEKKVTEHLTRKKIDNYCPVNKVIKQWSDRKKVIYEPLFSSYVFVRVSEFGITSLKQIPGIINVVYWLGKPAVIRDSEIEVIKRFLCEHINIKLEKKAMAINDQIEVLGGPLMELEGKVLSIGNNTVKVALPSLGYMMFAELETSNVKVISHIPTEINMNYPLYAAR